MNFNVKILKKTISSIEISWNSIDECQVYKVENIEKNKDPNIVYWGSKPHCTIENLPENVCYCLKIFALTYKNNEFFELSSSSIIKANTLPNIPTTVSIYRALKKSQEYLLKRYLKAKPYLVNVPGPNGFTPLANAAVFGDRGAVEILLESGAKVDVGCPITGRTPLQLTLFYGFVTIAKLLLDFKAQRNIKDCNGMNFAHYAVDGGHLNAIEFAVKNIENIEDKDKFGKTILLRAVLMQCKPEVLTLLLQLNCDINAIDNNKLTALDIAQVTNQSELAAMLESHIQQKTK